ncbi:MAG: hypothetical protein JNG88_16160 [Phycisphaerales bacterium]|nr:hypothetical protein [Phycisphaerales bacterium]
MASRGIDIRESVGPLLVRAMFQDAGGAMVTSGSATYRLFELQADGTLKSFDFNDNTLKTGALTTATAALTHRTGNNGTYSTGVWTAALSNVAGFTKGKIYFVECEHASASPTKQTREFQWGQGEGDTYDEIHLAKAALVNKQELDAVNRTRKVYDDDGATVLKTLAIATTANGKTETPS